MKDHKVFVFMLFTGLVFFLFLYFSKPFKKSVPPEAAVPANTAGLRSEIETLNSLIAAVTRINVELNAASQEEKRKISTLQKELNRALSSNTELSGELTRAKVGLELTAPIRSRLTALDGLLDEANFKQAQKNQLKKQLQTVAAELDSIDAKMPALLKENAFYKTQAMNLSRLLDQKEEALEFLQKEFKDAQLQKDMYNKNVRALGDQLSGEQTMKSFLEKRITDLEKIVDALRQSESGLQQEVRRLERELKENQLKQAQITLEKQELAKAKEENEKKAGESQDTVTILIKKNQELDREMNYLKLAAQQYDKERQSLLKEVSEYRAAHDNVVSLQQEVSSLREQLTQANSSYTKLSGEHKNVQDMVQQQEQLLSKRADKILVLQDRLTEAQNKLAEFKASYDSMEKDSAMSREHSVILRLENEKLRAELEQTKLALVDLQDKFSRMNDIFKTPEDKKEGMRPSSSVVDESLGNQSDSSTQTAGKTVNVELLPQTEQ